jgi:hypothetical protein
MSDTGSAVCKVRKCGRRVRARGLCSSHYRQVLKHGRVWPISRRRRSRRGTVKISAGFTVTPFCADVVKRVAKKRRQTINHVVTDVLENWFQRRKTRPARRKRKR